MNKFANNAEALVFAWGFYAGYTGNEQVSIPNETFMRSDFGMWNTGWKAGALCAEIERKQG